MEITHFRSRPGSGTYISVPWVFFAQFYRALRLIFAIYFVLIPRDLVMPIVNTLTQGILHDVSYESWAFWSLNNLARGSSTVTLPWVRLLNTDQLKTEPCGTLKFVYWAVMSLLDRTLSHMLTLANRPWRVSLTLKPPPIESWSCPSTRKPPAVSLNFLVALCVSFRYSFEYFPKWHTCVARYHHRDLSR